MAIKVFRRKAWQENGSVDIEDQQLINEYYAIKGLHDSYGGNYPKNLININP